MNRLDKAEKYARLVIQPVNETNLSNKKEYLEEADNALLKSVSKNEITDRLWTIVIAYHDSIFNVAKSQQLLELTTRYETVKKAGYKSWQFYKLIDYKWHIVFSLADNVWYSPSGDFLGSSMIQKQTPSRLTGFAFSNVLYFFGSLSYPS